MPYIYQFMIEQVTFFINRDLRAFPPRNLDIWDVVPKTFFSSACSKKNNFKNIFLKKYLVRHLLLLYDVPKVRLRLLGRQGKWKWWKKDPTGLQIRGSKYQTATSNSRGLVLTNLLGLVLGCIETKLCKKLCVGKLSPRSTYCTPLHRFGIESQKPGKPWGVL